MVVRPFLNSSHSMHTNLIDPLTCTPRTTSICSRNWPVFVACFSSVFVGFRRAYLCVESEFHLSRLTRESLQAEEEVYQGADVPGRQERAGPHHHPFHKILISILINTIIFMILPTGDRSDNV